MTAADRSEFVRAWRDWVRSAALVILIVASLRSAVADWNDVPTGSMKPAILVGDRIVVNKLAYDLKLPFTTWHLVQWDNPARGEIVVLYSPADGKRLVKRVVGMPGDRMAMRRGRLILNGTPVEYSPTDLALAAQPGLTSCDGVLARERLDDRSHLVMLAPERPTRGDFGPVAVPAGHYFVMGDNRDQSLDSRYFGSVGRSAIVGRAVAVAASVDPDRHFMPRWQRFLHRLD